MNLGAIEKLNKREKSVVVARLELELLRPVPEYVPVVIFDGQSLIDAIDHASTTQHINEFTR